MTNEPDLGFVSLLQKGSIIGIIHEEILIYAIRLKGGTSWLSNVTSAEKGLLLGSMLVIPIGRQNEDGCPISKACES